MSSKESGHTCLSPHPSSYYIISSCYNLTISPADASTPPRWGCSRYGIVGRSVLPQMHLMMQVSLFWPTVG